LTGIKSYRRLATSSHSTSTMASYLSYFTSNNASSAPPSSHGGTPQPAGSTWSSTFSSRIATLRKALTKDSEEDDPDNEDCSHISNVLRAYYTEKQRPLPEWLPPDPKRPVAPPPQPQGSYGQYGSAYGAGYGTQNTHSRGPSASGGRGGGLSDLWDPSPAPAVTGPAPQSLRAARPTPQSLRSNDSLRSQSQSSGSGQASPYGGPMGGARPLPSQRAGSYQTANPTASQAGGLGSRDRLRARLQGGGGSGRSSPSAGLNSGGSGGQGSYGGPGSNFGNQNRGGISQPYVSASEPWSTSDPYAFNGNYDDGGLSNTNKFGNQGHRQRPGGPR